MISLRVKRFLEANGVAYHLITHRPTYTTQRTAEASHVSGRVLAKTVIVKLDGALAMVVVRACDRVRLDDLARIMGTDRTELASEEDFRGAFPDAALGAEPPFGNLYGMPVYLCHDLAANSEMAFAAGSHTEVMSLKTADYVRLVKPVIVSCSLSERKKPD